MANNLCIYQHRHGLLEAPTSGPQIKVATQFQLVQYVTFFMVEATAGMQSFCCSPFPSLQVASDINSKSHFSKKLKD